MSDFITSLHLLSVPWHGLVSLNSPNKTLLGSLASPILPTWPNHLRHGSIMMSSIDFCKLKSFTSCLVVSLSFRCWYLVTPKIDLTHRLWKEFNFLASLAFSAQVSAPYNSSLIKPLHDKRASLKLSTVLHH